MSKVEEAMEGAADAGFALFKQEPELMVAAVWHKAADYTRAALVTPPQDRDVQQRFVNGYIDARRQHDEFRREQK